MPEKSGFWAQATVATARIAAAITPTRASFIVCSFEETAFCTSNLSKSDRERATPVPRGIAGVPPDPPGAESTPCRPIRGLGCPASSQSHCRHGRHACCDVATEVGEAASLKVPPDAQQSPPIAGDCRSAAGVFAGRGRPAPWLDATGPNRRPAESALSGSVWGWR